MVSPKIPNALRDVLEEIEQKVNFLKKQHGHKKKLVAKALGLDDGNLLGYFNGSKSIDLQTAKRLLSRLNKLYKKDLAGWVPQYSFRKDERGLTPKNLTGEEKSNAELQIQIDELKITNQAQFIVLVRRLAAAGVNMENLNEEIEKQKDVLRSKNNPQ